MNIHEPIGDDFTGQPRPALWFSIRGLMLAVLAVALLLVLFQLLPALQSTTYHRRHPQMSCASNLRQVGLALQGYHNAYGCFPPPYIADSTGRPMHSWRTLVLPFLDQQDLFNEYKFDEPWDGPNNRKIADVGIGLYHCPARLDRRPGLTDYVLIRGPGTAFPGGGKRVSLGDVKDDHASTILLVEIVGSGIHWAEPRDLEISKLSFKINDPSRPGPSSPHSGAVNILMMDGSINFLEADLNPAIVKALITIDGGEIINKGDLDH